MQDLTRRAALLLAGGGLAFAGCASASAAAAQAPGSARAAAGSVAEPIRYVDLNGTRLGYRRHSGGGGRRPLVLVHGYSLSGTGEVYTALIDGLTSDFDVYALDLRGHGASAASSANWSQAAIADDLAAFVRKLGLRGAVYAGHSLGGFTGLYAQIRHPGTFSALALLATAVAQGGTPPPGLKEAFVARGRDPGFTEPAFSGMYLRPKPRDIRRAAEAVAMVPPSVHETFFSNFAKVVITDRLPEIRVPVLLINGGKDTVVSPAEQHITALGLGLHKEVTFSHEGHMLPIESAEATAREMLTFFRHDVAGY